MLSVSVPASPIQLLALDRFLKSLEGLKDPVTGHEGRHLQVRLCEADLNNWPVVEDRQLGAGPGTPINELAATKELVDAWKALHEILIAWALALDGTSARVPHPSDKVRHHFLLKFGGEIIKPAVTQPLHAEDLAARGDTKDKPIAVRKTLEPHGPPGGQTLTVDEAHGTGTASRQR